MVENESWKKKKKPLNEYNEKKLYKKNVKVVKIKICVKMGVIKALVAVELNSYIVILTPPKHKKQPYSSGAKSIFSSFIATVHNYLWLCTVAESYNNFLFQPGLKNNLSSQYSQLSLFQLSDLSLHTPPPLDPCRHRPSSPAQLWLTPSANPSPKSQVERDVA